MEAREVGTGGGVPARPDGTGRERVAVAGAVAVSRSQQVGLGDAQAPGGGDTGADGSPSRPSKNNRHVGSDPIEPSDLPGPSRRPLAVEAGATLRDEARAVKVGPGDVVPLSKIGADDLDPDDEIQARPTYRVVREWRRWMLSYRNSHIEYESDEGETVRAPLENSYQTDYARRYYARMKDLERAVEREYESLTTVMLTFTASHRNAEGLWRCPADHISDVRDGWDTARKHLYDVLDGYRWEYARILEPHRDGYGHLHVALFIEADELEAERFRPVMESHVGRVGSAGSEAHGLDQAGLGDAVSVSAELDSLAGYLSEYLGAFADGTALDRPMNEQTFLAVTWATNSRRLDFSNGAQSLIADERFRRETGLRPEDRGEADSGDESAPSGGATEEGPTWTVDALCEVEGREPNYYDPTAGGIRGGPIDGRDGVDPPRRVD